MAKIVVLGSGGIRSAAAAAIHASDHALMLLHIDYGQPAVRMQRKALNALARTFPNARCVGLDLPQLAELPALAGENEGAGAGEPDSPARKSPSLSQVRGLMPVLAALAGQFAMRVGAHSIVTGLAEAEENAPTLLAPSEQRPSQAREFASTFAAMLETTLPPRAKLQWDAPLLDLLWADSVKLALRFHVPLEHTWSCDQGHASPCGQCTGCRVRADAFTAARLQDPAAAALLGKAAVAAS